MEQRTMEVTEETYSEDEEYFNQLVEGYKDMHNHKTIDEEMEDKLNEYIRGIEVRNFTLQEERSKLITLLLWSANRLSKGHKDNVIKQLNDITGGDYGK